MRFSEARVREAVLDSYRAHIWQVEAMDPRLAPSKHKMVVRHLAWFDSPEKPHPKLAAPPVYIKALMRFRIGHVPLRIHTE